MILVKGIKKRSLLIYSIFMTLLMTMIIRLYYVSNSENYAAAAQNQSNYSLTVSETRGCIYDRFFMPLVNDTFEHKAAVLPTNESLKELSDKLSSEKRETAIKLVQGRKPFVMNIDAIDLYDKNISVFKTLKRYPDNLMAPHIIGYVDGDNNGVYGIEKSFNTLLKDNSGKLTIKYQIDALGRHLSGTYPEVTDTRSNSNKGVVLTIDKDIQRATEFAMRNKVQKGAAVVMDVETGDILASVSMPEFDPLNLEKSLQDKNAPFVNRAFSSYNIGSTFKLVVAAAAIEQGISTKTYHTCSGSEKVGDIMFHCHKRTGHGRMDLRTAIMYSCNPYFINLGKLVGAKSICEMATRMGFGRLSSFTEDIKTAAGNVPNYENIINAGDLANISFGQGELMATPIQICRLFSVIANGGYLAEPTLIKGITDKEGKMIEEPAASYTPQRIIKEKTANLLKQYLIDTVMNGGTGNHAIPEVGGAGGKTSSAQTGVYVNDTEIVHAGFAGFYPAEKPKYSIYVLAEEMVSGGEFSAKIFKEICDSINSIEQRRLKEQEVK